MDRLALRIGRLCGSEDCRLEGFVDRKTLWIGRLCGSEGSVDRKALCIGRLYESGGSTDRSASGSDVGLVRNSPTPIAWFVEACFSPGRVDPVFHIPLGRHVPLREGTTKI